jgi:hypothetical protein
MGGKKRALQNTYRTGRDRRRRSRRLPLSGPLSGVGTFFGLSIRTSSQGDCYRYLDQDLSRDSGLLPGSRSGPLFGVRTSIDISIRTSLGSRDFLWALDQEFLSRDFYQCRDQDLSLESGLISGSRSGPPLLGLVSGSRWGPLSKLLLGDLNRDLFPDLDQDLFRDLNRGLGQANRYYWPVFSFPQKFCHFLEKQNWEFFGIVFFLV